MSVRPSGFSSPWRSLVHTDNRFAPKTSSIRIPRSGGDHRAHNSIMAIISDRIWRNQFSKPTAWLGRYTLWRMTSHHSKLTDWGLKHTSIESHFTILDVGCGGGRTVNKL